MSEIPRTVEEYLEQLAYALRDADPALRQDALYDAEEYLRAEVAGNPGRPVSEVIASIVTSYGAPEEVAEVYRQTEETVARALRTPKPRQHSSALKQFFGVYADPRTYSSLFYMLLSLATGIFYFTWTVTGVSLSFGTIILIFGLPLTLLFIGSTRLLSLVEGRIVETLLGTRMPRRPLYPSHRDESLWERIKAMLTDVRTWSTMLYMLLMLPLGTAYFTFAFTTLCVALALIVAPLGMLLGLQVGNIYWHGPVIFGDWDAVFYPLFGILLLTVSMHVYRGVGRLQGHIAHGLLVKVSAR
ncbi:MAG: sensor domain-containing protein [Gammaproteobacteria bacterium]|nr:sensor domain-containing protein [Gammaproteobacteria bacterium]